MTHFIVSTKLTTTHNEIESGCGTNFNLDIHVGVAQAYKSIIYWMVYRTGEDSGIICKDQLLL